MPQHACPKSLLAHLQVKLRKLRVATPPARLCCTPFSITCLSNISACSASFTALVRRRRCRVSAPKPPNDSGLWIPDASPTCSTLRASQPGGEQAGVRDKERRKREREHASGRGACTEEGRRAAWLAVSHCQCGCSDSIIDGKDGTGTLDPRQAGRPCPRLTHASPKGLLGCSTAVAGHSVTCQMANIFMSICLPVKSRLQGAVPVGGEASKQDPLHLQLLQIHTLHGAGTAARTLGQHTLLYMLRRLPSSCANRDGPNCWVHRIPRLKPSQAPSAVQQPQAPAPPPYSCACTQCCSMGLWQAYWYCCVDTVLRQTHTWYCGIRCQYSSSSDSREGLSGWASTYLWGGVKMVIVRIVVA